MSKSLDICPESCTNFLPETSRPKEDNRSLDPTLAAARGRCAAAAGEVEARRRECRRAAKETDAFVARVCPEPWTLDPGP